MKKLISLLGAISLTATAAVAVVACSPQLDGKDYDKLVGMGIDRSNALADSNLKNDLGFTNFYTIGDSLSDSGGIETLASKTINQVLDVVNNVYENPAIKDALLTKLSELLSKMINSPLVSPGVIKGIFEKFLISVGEGIPQITSANVKFELTGENGKNEYAHGFTNAKPAAVLLAEELGFNKGPVSKKFNAGVKTNILGFNVESDSTLVGLTKNNGNNYAIGGATASTVEGMTGMLLNAVQIQDQAAALLQQHKTLPTDLVFMEIGGNDLFSMITLYQNNGTEAEIQAIMDEALENIKIAMLTLLNNGLGNIIVANAPDVSKIPRYNNDDTSDDVKTKAHKLSMEFNQRFIEQFNEINAKYNNTMRVYDLGVKIDEMLDEFEGNITDPSVNLAAGFDISVNEEKHVLNITIKNEIKPESTDINQYFFWDTIHPNSWAHEQVEIDLLELATEMRLNLPTEEGNK